MSLPEVRHLVSVIVASGLLAKRLHALSSEVTSTLIAQSAVLSTEAQDLVAGGVEPLA
jgi:hypothetical protein